MKRFIIEIEISISADDPDEAKKEALKKFKPDGNTIVKNVEVTQYLPF